MMSQAVVETQLVCTEPGKVAAYFMPKMKFLEYEQVRLLILNGRNALVEDIVISMVLLILQWHHHVKYFIMHLSTGLYQ